MKRRAVSGEVPGEIPRDVTTFRDLAAAMTPVMWLRAIVLAVIVVVGALIGLAVVLALVLATVLAAIRGFEHIGSAALTTIWPASIAHAWR